MVKYLAIVLLILSIQVAADPAMRLCVDHYPPYQVVYGNQQVKGISIQFVTQLANKLNTSLKIQISESLDECIRKAVRGETDFVAGLHASKRRAEVFELYRYSDGYSNTLFVIRDDSPNIVRLKDLYGKKVGVVKSYKYFSDFDNDRGNIKKVIVEHIGQLIYQLQSRLVDVIAIPTHHWQSVSRIVNSKEQFKVAKFYQKMPRPVHLGLAKNANWSGNKKELKKVIKLMYQDNEIERLINQHFSIIEPDLFADQNIERNTRD